MNQITFDLAYAYRILSHLKLDDHTYTHLSARKDNTFYILPFGLMFSEVTPENLLEVTLDGKVIKGSEYQYNKTGYIIHGEIYRARPDVKAIFHIHTPEIVAVSSFDKGLTPTSQWALHFYNRVAYHAYDSLALNSSQGANIVTDLKNHKIMLLQNHGSITTGLTIQEAMFYTYHLQLACQTQCLAFAMNGGNIIQPPTRICQQSVQDLLNFESNLGERDWKAWLRLNLL
jgi:ribulose-5-phosphate 4-epimerase/fuculose-1-phosphate aldolase